MYININQKTTNNITVFVSCYLFLSSSLLKTLTLFQGKETIILLVLDMGY